MTPALLADVAVWPIFVVGGAILVGGISAAVGLVWFGFWLQARRQRKPDAGAEDVP